MSVFIRSPIDEEFEKRRGSCGAASSPDDDCVLMHASFTSRLPATAGTLSPSFLSMASSFPCLLFSVSSFVSRCLDVGMKKEAEAERHQQRMMRELVEQMPDCHENNERHRQPRRRRDDDDQEGKKERVGEKWGEMLRVTLSSFR